MFDPGEYLRACRTGEPCVNTLPREESNRRLAAYLASEGPLDRGERLRSLGRPDEHNGNGVYVELAWAGVPEETILKRMRPEDRQAIALIDPAIPSPTIEIEPLPGSDMPPLPAVARLDPALGIGACPWLDAYIGFSRLWSPRAYDGFHEACAMWLLSTVAARRVYCHLGGLRFTNLYLALTARTTLFAKSSTVKIVSDTLRASGLDWLLAADDATPQRFIADLVQTIPGDYDRLDPEAQQRILMRAAFSAQRGWFYEEFGQKVHAMLQPSGFMADFRGILRAFDDCPLRYEYGTISRGSDIVIEPYLALLANMTPDDLRNAARKNDALWGDGFWARYAFVTPPPGTNRSRDRFPSEMRIIPASLTMPIRDWHQRLGGPTVEIESVKDDHGKTMGYQARKKPYTYPPLSIAPDVFEAFYVYQDGLLDALDNSETHDFDGSYGRFAEKALRVAMLQASVSNCDTVELRHWARAQEMTERWRAGLHSLYAQVNAPAASEEAKREDKAVQLIRKLGTPTAAEVGRYMWGVSGKEAVNLLEGLVMAGVLQHVEGGSRKKVIRYALVP